jgi:hypothetical protein
MIHIDSNNLQNLPLSLKCPRDLQILTKTYLNVIETFLKRYKNILKGGEKEEREKHWKERVASWIFDLKQTTNKLFEIYL